MNFADILTTKVKPELNHIYTEMPFQTPGGLDLGWFCREHALHLYGLSALLGKPTDILIGDFILRIPGQDSFHSVGETTDHSWCRVGDCVPVDLSATVKHIYPGAPALSLVYGEDTGRQNPFEIRYCVDWTDDAFLELVKSEKPLIAYNERECRNPGVLDLLTDPSQFFLRPLPGNPTFQEIHGPDVYHAITYHCYRLATEDIKPLCRYREPRDAVKRIMQNNPKARDIIQERLG